MKKLKNTESALDLGVKVNGILLAGGRPPTEMWVAILLQRFHLWSLQ